MTANAERYERMLLIRHWHDVRVFRMAPGVHEIPFEGTDAPGAIGPWRIAAEAPRPTTKWTREFIDLLGQVIDEHTQVPLLPAPTVVVRFRAAEGDSASATLFFESDAVLIHSHEEEAGRMRRSREGFVRLVQQMFPADSELQALR